MDEQEAIKAFRSHIVLCEGITTKQVAWHEAGHRFFWRAAFPEIKTRYSIKGGLPMASPIKEHIYSIADMDMQEASRFAYVKLGGISAEMIMLGLDAHADAIANWLVDDYTMLRTLDWDDDAAHGGDLSHVFLIVEAKTNLQSLRENFRRILQSCLANLQEGRADFDKEAQEATRLFAEWRRQGKWKV